MLLLKAKFGARIEELAEVLVDALLAGGVIGLLHVVFLVKILAVAGYILHLHGGLVERWDQILRKLRILGLSATALHHRACCGEVGSRRSRSFRLDGHRVERSKVAMEGTALSARSRIKV